jgi:hypothetical protein
VTDRWLQSHALGPLTRPTLRSDQSRRHVLGRSSGLGTHFVTMTESQDPSIHLVVDNFFPAAMLYRRACAQQAQAIRMAQEFVESGQHERRLREMDAVMSTVVLTQAAGESWIYSAYRKASVRPRRVEGWVQRWIDSPVLICGDGTRALNKSTEDSLRTLSNWRNFLVHGDDAAGRRLHAVVSAGDVAERLTSELAQKVIQDMDDAFTDDGSLLGVHGTTGLHSSHLWVAPDEGSPSRGARATIPLDSSAFRCRFRWLPGRS